MKVIPSHQKAMDSLDERISKMRASDDFLWDKQPQAVLLAFNQMCYSAEYVLEHFDQNPKPTKSVA